MHDQVDAAIRAVEIARREINRIRDKLAVDDDQRRGTVDNAEMGTEWVIKQLEQLKKTSH
jgi:hypothetical protein